MQSMNPSVSRAMDLSLGWSSAPSSSERLQLSLHSRQMIFIHGDGDGNGDCDGDDASWVDLGLGRPQKPP